jgi:hypothetical protein
LEAEKARLKKLLVDWDLGIDLMKELAAKKNRERVGPARVGPLRDDALPVTVDGLRATLGAALDRAVCVDEGGEGCAGAGGDGCVVGAVSVVRVSTHPCFVAAGA